jgi:hypothetical protein
MTPGANRTRKRGDSRPRSRPTTRWSVAATVASLVASGCGARSDLAAIEGRTTGLVDAGVPTEASTMPDGQVHVVTDGSPSDVRVVPDAGAMVGSDGGGGCTSFESRRVWANNNCPPLGCPPGTVCVEEVGAASGPGPLGCAPVLASCGGTPTCGCMGCVCIEQRCDSTSSPGEILCR